MAQDAFREMMRPEIPEERRQQLGQALLRYCERDTWADWDASRIFSKQGLVDRSTSGAYCLLNH